MPPDLKPGESPSPEPTPTSVNGSNNSMTASTTGCGESPMESPDFDDELFDAVSTVSDSTYQNITNNSSKGIDEEAVEGCGKPKPAPSSSLPPNLLLPKKFSFTAGGAPQVPLVSSVQKIILYETKQRYYLIGTNNMENKYRVLKVDRTDAKELIIHDDGVTYSQKEIKQMLQMIDVGNRTKQVRSCDICIKYERGTVVHDGWVSSVCPPFFSRLTMG